MSFVVDRRNLDFMLYELFGLEDLLQHERYADYDRTTMDAVLDTAQSIAEEEFLPSAAKLDANEPAFDGKNISIIPEVGEALNAYREAGFFGTSFSPELGGAGLPGAISLASWGMFAAANFGIADYPFLTSAAANMLEAFASEEQKQLYLSPMIEGRWFGTMCLSEPHAGSSLSDIRTTATPTDEDHYLIKGTKMWISGGDQDLSENIVEMVLAKIPGGPPGVKGISLFIVPKFRVNSDGSLGEKNNIAVAGLNHKMGRRGTTNCLLNFGESGECHGYLVGEPHQGLRYMFHMMNEARIAVGHGAAISALAGFLYSFDYALNRPQGRLPQDKDPASPQVPIVQHADIKRLLLAQKSSVEGALGLIYYCQNLLDQNTVSDDQDANAARLRILDILTPIAKSWPSEYCLEANKHAIQILGGYGYTRDYPVERFYRDNRLNHIHEGTHAIHGIDLLGRKVTINDGECLAALIKEMKATITAANSNASLADLAEKLSNAIESLEKSTQSALDCPDLTLRLANATPYLDAFGHVVIAWIWLKQAILAQAALDDEANQETAFYQGKIAACQYFFRYELPKVFAAFELVASLDDTCLELQAEQLADVP